MEDMMFKSEPGHQTYWWVSWLFSLLATSHPFPQIEWPKDKVQWQAIVNMVLDHLLPQKKGILIQQRGYQIWKD